MKILIVAKWYPPDLKVPARRWGNLVRYLQAANVECTVVAAGGRDVLGTHIGPAGETIIRLPIPNLEPTSKPVSARPMSSSARQKVGRALLSFSPPILRDRSWLEWMRYARTSRLIEVAKQSTCVISSYGPLGPLVMGRRLAIAARRPWVADIRDSFEARDGVASALAKKVSRRVEASLLRSAAVRVTIGGKLAEYLTGCYASSFAAIYNGWTEDDCIQRRNVSAQDTFLYYAGSIYIHQLPALELVLHALRQVRSVRLRIRLLKDNTRGGFERLLERREFSGLTEVLPAVEPEVVREELSRSIGAVVLEDLRGDSDLANATVTGKLLGLLASGAPGIAISSPLGEIRAIAGKVPTWHTVDSIHDAVSAITTLSSCIDTQDVSGVMKPYHAAQQASRLLELIRVSGSA